MHQEFEGFKELFRESSLPEAQVIACLMGPELYKEYLVQKYREWFNSQTKTEILLDEIDGFTPDIPRLEMMFKLDRDQLVDFLVNEWEDRLSGFTSMKSIVNNFV